MKILSLFISTTVLSLIVFVGTPSTGFAEVIHVDPAATGSGDGTSWTNAMTDLRLALAGAQAGDEVWVARGTYLPSPGTNRTDTFLINHGITLLGGFEPGMDDPMQRRIHEEENRTVLSGNIGNQGSNAGNLFHVVTVGTFSGTLIIDGFVIRDGNRTATVSEEPEAGARGGAGLAAANGNGLLVVRNCSFRNNIARGLNGTSNGEDGVTILGGAVHAPLSVRFEDCLFFGNEARGGNGANSGSIHFSGADGGDARGGAVWTLDGEFKRCYFEWNWAIGGQGGGGRQGANGASSGAGGQNASAGGSGGDAWGGAVIALGGYVKETYFHGNHARPGVGGAGGRGGHGAAGNNGTNGTTGFTDSGTAGGNGSSGGNGGAGGHGGPSGSARGGAFHGLVGFGGQPIEDCVFVGNTVASASGGAGGNGGNRGKGGNGGNGGDSTFGNGGRGGNGGSTGSSGAGGNAGAAGDAIGGAVYFADARFKLLNESTFAHNWVYDRGSGGARGANGGGVGIGEGGSGGTSTFGSDGANGSAGTVHITGFPGAPAPPVVLSGAAVYALEVEPGSQVQTFNSFYWKNFVISGPGHFGGARPGSMSGTNFTSDIIISDLGGDSLTGPQSGFLIQPWTGSGWDQDPNNNNYGDLRRRVNSIGTNAGVNTDSFQTANSTDIAGNPRILNGTISLGAYEMEMTDFQTEHGFIGETLNANGDEFDNFIHYMLGNNPEEPLNRAHLGVMTINEGQLTINFRRRPNAIHGVEHYEGSTDLETWTVLEPGFDYVETSTFTGVSIEDVEMTFLGEPAPLWFWRRVIVR
ncbi:MAG: hypothetical protein LAT83_11545 [Kiritimatiellae bacterium]|nr:hypothetical protein [Kiritimatiellia bacterium]